MNTHHFCRDDAQLARIKAIDHLSVVLARSSSSREAKLEASEDVLCLAFQTIAPPDRVGDFWLEITKTFLSLILQVLSEDWRSMRL